MRRDSREVHLKIVFRFSGRCTRCRDDDNVIAESDGQREAVGNNVDQMSITKVIVVTTLIVQPKYAMPLLKDTLTLYTEEGVTDTVPTLSGSIKSLWD